MPEYSLREICFLMENLKGENYTTELNRKDGLPLNCQEKKSISNVPVLHEYLISLDFNDGKAYSEKLVFEWFFNHMVETKNKDNIFIYSEQSRFSNFRWAGVYEMLDKEKHIPYQELKHTSELLEILHHCIADNWENHDPSNPPKNEYLKRWFEGKYPDSNPLSLSVIGAMCTIMRPDKYR